MLKHTYIGTESVMAIQVLFKLVWKINSAIVKFIAVQRVYV